MKDSLRFAKKAISIAVTATTIAWSVGLASFVPLATQAATPGSLIKMSGNSAVYYLAADGKRYVFPNQTTYNTWYPDFSTVQTISQSELQSYSIGGNVTMRPGTKLAKITTDPKVYAIEPGGSLRWVTTEAIAQTLYGDNWASRVVDVPDAFFVNYKPGSDLTSAMYPTGSLVKSSSSSDIFYVDGSSKRHVQPSGLTANMLQASNAVTATDAVFNALSAGTDITAAEPGIWSIVSGVSVSTGTGLTVALASDTPASGIQAAPTAYNPALKINLTASTDGSVNVTGINLTRQGVSQDSYIAGVGIYDASGHRYGNVVTFGNNVAMVTFANDPIIVPAGQTIAVWAKTNLASGVFSGTYALSVAQASDIVTTATVNGAFPVQGNGFSLIQATGIASVTIQSQSQSGGTLAAPTQVDQGTANVSVTKFAVSETSGQEDAKLTRLTITQNGSASDADYGNIRLIDQNGVTVATTPTAVSGKLTFDLTAAPVVIPKGQIRYFTVVIDTSSNTNSANRTLDFTIQNDYDVEAYGANSGAGILPTAANLNQFPIGDGLGTTGGQDVNEVSNYMQFKAGTLSISKSTTSPSGKMAPGATNQVLASFDVQAFGEPVEIQKVNFAITADGTHEIANNGHVLTGTIRIQNGSGGIIYSATATNPTLYTTDGVATVSNGVISTEASSGAAVGTLPATTLNSYYVVTPGTTGQLVFVGDIPQGATTSDNYEILITSIYARKVSSNNFVTINTTATGNQRQVDTTSLTVSSNTSYNPVQLVKGASNVRIGSFNVQAGPAEAINLTTLNVNIGSSASSTIDFTTGAPLYSGGTTTGISNVKLMIGTTQFGSTISNPTAVTGDSFSGTATVAASGTVTVDVYADVSTNFTANDYLGAEMKVTAGVGQSSQTNITTASYVVGQAVKMTTGGTLLLQSDTSDTPIQEIVHSNQVDVPVLSLKVSESTNSENLTMNKLYFAVTNGGSNYQDIKLFSGSTQVGQTVQLVNGEARFTGLGLAVNKGASPMVLTVKATATGSGVQTPGSQSFFAPTYYEYVGASSGSTTRVGGGVISTASTNGAVTAPTIIVNDASQFSTSDRIAIDVNNNGTISAGTTGTTLANGAETNDNNGFIIASISGNTLTLTAASTAIGDLLDTTVGGRVIAYDDGSHGDNVSSHVSFQSSAMINHNSEPIATLNSSASTGANGSSGQPIATFTISNQGSRDISVAALQVKFTGSFVGTSATSGSCAGTGGIYDVELWQNNQVQNVVPYRNTTAGTTASCFASGDSASFLLASPITISAGGSTDFVVKGNTSLTRYGLTSSGTISYGVYLDGTQGSGQLLGGTATAVTANRLGGIRWDYSDVNGIYGSTGTTTAGAAPIFTSANAATGQVMDVSDNYPVNGPVINY